MFGNPQFEPQLKAGASWTAQLKIPEAIRETVARTIGPLQDQDVAPSVTWVIEVASQILFSISASVHFEIVVGRDEKSIDFGFAGLVGTPNSVPGHLSDHQKGRNQNQNHHAITGVYSKSISLLVEDTTSLWNKPELPHFKDDSGKPIVNSTLAESDPTSINPEQDTDDVKKYGDGSKPSPTDKKRVHLVVITHGLHSNLGADMLYLKESIDTAAKQAKLDRRMRRAKRKSKLSRVSVSQSSTQEASEKNMSLHSSESIPSRTEFEEEGEDKEDDGDVSEDEEVLVRGFGGNATRTERGIQYLGKRLAKYVLAITYPDQPYLPLKKGKPPLTKAFGNSDKRPDLSWYPSHHGHSASKEKKPTENLAYQVTSISFIGHSLGGLTQTYAIAYIHKHSPDFFKHIRPLNFVTLASPFLGLSNENPIYIKFALGFGLVGRTGQDLGLTWRAPTLARSGWSTMIAGMGTEGQRKQRQLDPGSKPLLRILPAGPAHQVLRLFKNRTVYSNVVNDGVVPLRTSCLLFLDWRGLGRVEKARRGDGVIGTVANWGWAELTGANASEYQRFKFWFDNNAASSDDSNEGSEPLGPQTTSAARQVPQPTENATQEDNIVAEVDKPDLHQFIKSRPIPSIVESVDLASPDRHESPGSSPLAGFFNLFKPTPSQKRPKQKRIYRRGQTTIARSDDESSYEPRSPDLETMQQTESKSEHSTMQTVANLFTPPATSIFESASDILNPPIPTLEFLTDPSTRPRTIFHDRVYHPDDIPPPPIKKQFTMRRNPSGEVNTMSSPRHSTPNMESSSSTIDAETGSMKVEEKIARAYHRDLSWRKVLVRLEPDAHNNIVVRRMFANAYGWPVIKHLVDTHFADSYAARIADAYEANTERARPMDEPVNEHGDEVTERPKPKPRRASTGSSNTEAQDHLGSLGDMTSAIHSGHQKPQIMRMDSGVWDDRFFNSDSDDDEDEFEPQRLTQLRPTGHVPQSDHPTAIQHDLDSIVIPPALEKKNLPPIVVSELKSPPKDTKALDLQKSTEERNKPIDANSGDDELTNLKQ